MGYSPLPFPPLSLREAPGQELTQRIPGLPSPHLPSRSLHVLPPGPAITAPPPASRQTNPPALRRHWLPAGGRHLRPLAGNALWSRLPYRHLGSGGGGVAAMLGRATGVDLGRGTSFCVRWWGGIAEEGCGGTHSTEAVCGSVCGWLPATWPPGEGAFP